jgi:hypothetical protein
MSAASLGNTPIANPPRTAHNGTYRAVSAAQIAGYVRFVGVILLWVKVLVFGF